MNGIFIHILSMSITAGYCIVAVILIRFLLKRQPKVFSYMLWSIVLFRLLCPVSLSSPFSVLPVNPDTVLQDTAYYHGENSLPGGETGKTAESGDNTGDRYRFKLKLKFRKNCCNRTCYLDRNPCV